MRALVARLLRTLGVGQIAQAVDGQQAAEILDDITVDLVISDLEMPRLDGIELTRALRRRGDDTPVIMLSGQDDARVIARARRAGVSEYLVKPIEAAALADLIAKTMFIPERSLAGSRTIGLISAKTRRRRSA